MLLLFFFNDTATTEIYTLSLHDALPIYPDETKREAVRLYLEGTNFRRIGRILGVNHQSVVNWVNSYHVSLPTADRKSTRLNSSHANISYAVFCLKKKKNTHMDVHIDLIH